MVIILLNIIFFCIKNYLPRLITYAIASVQSGKSNYSLVLSSDKRKSRVGSAQELDFGDASAAIGISNDNIIAKVLAVSKNRTDTRIYVRGDKTINYGRVLEIMGLLSGSGFTKVALISEPCS